MSRTGWHWPCWLASMLWAVVASSGKADEPRSLLWQHELPQAVTHIARSPDGKQIAVAGWGATVQLLRAADGCVDHVLPCSHHVSQQAEKCPVLAIDYSPDGTYIALGIGKSKHNAAQLWRVADGTLVRAFPDFSYVSCLDFSPDGQQLAIAQLRTIFIVNVDSGEIVKTLAGHQHNVTHLEYAPDGRSLASSGFDKTVRLWNAQTGELQKTLSDSSDPMSAVAFSPDGSLLAASGGPHIWLWQLSSSDAHTLHADLIRKLDGHAANVHCVAFSPNGQVLAAGSGAHDQLDSEVRLWSLVDGKLLEQMPEADVHQQPVMSVVFSPDGSSLYSGGADRRVLHWRIADSTVASFSPSDLDLAPNIVRLGEVVTFRLNPLPEDVSVEVEKSGGHEPVIHVRQGRWQWSTINGSLAALPETPRKYVQSMFGIDQRPATPLSHEQHFPWNQVDESTVLGPLFQATVNWQLHLNDLPNDMVFRLSKSGDKPTHVHVEQGRLRWETQDGSLGGLPPEVQRQLERMLGVSGR